MGYGVQPQRVYCHTHNKKVSYNSSPKSVPIAQSNFGIQVFGHRDQQLSILQQTYTKHNHLCKPIPWFPGEKYQIPKPNHKANCIQDSSPSIGGTLISSMEPYTKTNIDKLEIVQCRAVMWSLHNYSPYATVTEMLQSLDWRSLQQRRSDSRLCLFYKMVYGFVAVELPQYVVHPMRNPSRTHIPCLTARFILQWIYYTYSYYPLAIVQCIRLPLIIALLPTFDFFKRADYTVCVCEWLGWGGG